MSPYYPLLALLAPLTAGLIIGLLGGMIGKKVYKIGVWAEVIAFGASLQILYEVITQGPQIINIAFPAAPGSGILQLGLYIDRLAAVMMVHITGISTLIHLFSIRYMQQERGYARFHSLLALTTFVLLGMVSSANILMLFVYWQLLSWLLCLLAYNYPHPPTVRGAFRTFTMQRFGDVAFLSAIVLAWTLYGTLDFQQLFIRAAEVQTIFSLWPVGGIEIRASTTITLLIFLGAMSKSAQFPLHMWLPDSLYAPTPVHALLHAGIINAGGFLLGRLAPLYALSPATLHVVFVIGLLTALLGSSMMLTQNDIKKTLGYSTIGQMGFMIMECGLGAFALAIFHLIAHGLFKATIFLNCGHVIHAAREEPRFPPKDGATKKIEFSSLTWLTGFVTTLILPLIILLAVHGVLRIPLKDSQGAVIFLFFGWVTSSQAILTLYRLHAVASWKVAGSMLFCLFLVVLTYLLAAETFTYFLYPAAGEVAYHFKAGALPGGLFDFVVAAASLFIILGWIFIYARSHGQTIRIPHWVNTLQVRLYLLFMNRLYLDALSFRLGRRLAHMAQRLNANRLFPFVVALIALSVALPVAAPFGDLSVATGARFLASALLLPLFPLHGVYVVALTRMPGYWPICCAVLLPAVGLYGIHGVLSRTPAEFFTGISVLALFGALYGSLKAVTQLRMTYTVAYTSVVSYSVLWWYLAESRILTPAAVVYGSSAVLVSVGLFLAWHRVQVRYGNLALNHIGGLARPMPRFAILVSLLVMAAIGLPPFGLFAGFVGMLLYPSVGISWDLTIILLTWFAASWYLFAMLQRLLFGPHRTDILYDDLRHAEIVPFLIILLILVASGTMPYGFFEVDRLATGYHTLLEMTLWNK